MKKMTTWSKAVSLVAFCAAGLASQPLMSGYNASKFAVRGLTESLRQDLDILQVLV